MAMADLDDIMELLREIKQIVEGLAGSPKGAAPGIISSPGTFLVSAGRLVEAGIADDRLRDRHDQVLCIPLPKAPGTPSS